MTDPFAPNPASSTPAEPSAPLAVSPSSAAPAVSTQTMPALTPAPKKSRSGVFFGIVSLVLLLAAGGVGALYYIDHDKAAKTQSEQQTKIDGLTAQVKDLEDQLATAATEADTAKSAAQKAETELKTCKDSLQAFINALATTTTDEQGTQILLDVVTKCKLTVPMDLLKPPAK